MNGHRLVPIKKPLRLCRVTHCPVILRESDEHRENSAQRIMDLSGSMGTTAVWEINLTKGRCHQNQEQDGDKMLDSETSTRKETHLLRRLGERAMWASAKLDDKCWRERPTEQLALAWIGWCSTIAISPLVCFLRFVSSRLPTSSSASFTASPSSFLFLFVSSSFSLRVFVSFMQTSPSFVPGIFEGLKVVPQITWSLAPVCNTFYFYFLISDKVKYNILTFL